MGPAIYPYEVSAIIAGTLRTWRTLRTLRTLTTEALSPDNDCMYLPPFAVTVILFILALILLTLYVMRRRVRLGKRKGKF